MPSIIFNRDKFQFTQVEAEFVGFELTQEGYRPLKKIIAVIKDFPRPKSITNVRSWLGFVNQLAYSFAQAPIMEPFHGLLSAKSFYWDSSLDQLFQKSKEKIIELVQDSVKTFFLNRPTCLATYWSKVGIGFNLTQKHCRCPAPYDPNCEEGHWKLVFAGSCFTTDIESCYAPIKREALAVAYGLQQCRMFVMGAPNLILAVDHKSLIKVLND